MRSSLRNLALLFFSLLLTVSSVHAESVKRSLAGYHFNRTTAELESEAGGRDALIAELLKLRTDESTPFVAIRAQKLLLSYSEEKAVQSALVEDMSSSNRAGLARAIVLHLDEVKDTSLKRNLAEKALSRAAQESKFRPYARALLSSNDEILRNLAKSQLPAE